MAIASFIAASINAVDEDRSTQILRLAHGSQLRINHTNLPIRLRLLYPPVDYQEDQLVVVRLDPQSFLTGYYGGSYPPHQPGPIRSARETLAQLPGGNLDSAPPHGYTRLSFADPS